MEWKLTVKERQDLMQRHRTEYDGKVHDRIKAVLAYDEGYSYFEIAKTLLLYDETIHRHIEDYFNKQKLPPGNDSSESRLNPSEFKKLITHLSGFIYLYVKDICAYVKKGIRNHTVSAG